MTHASFVVRARFTSLLFALGLPGCSPGGIQGTPLDGVEPDASAPVATEAGSGGGTCVASPPPALDPSTLPSCCTDGAAHCVPTADVPAADQQALGTCSGGYCVPDPFITDPSYTPPSCTAFNGTKGACLSVCVPQVAQYKSLLTQDSCAATELCAPCTNPLTNAPSGACAFAPPSTTCTPGATDAGAPPREGDAGTTIACPYKGPPILKPSTLPACGPAGGAHCLQAPLVPKAMQSELATCAGGYCVPDVFIETGGNYIPPKCESLDDAEGRCLNLAIPQVTAEQRDLTQATCSSDERCVPCYSPLDGGSTGACDLSCDPGPTEPPVVFPGCCSESGSDQGRCVPTAIIPSSEQKNLSTSSCPKDTGLCVPSEMLGASFSPPACSATGFLIGAYRGVCLSDCLSFGIEGIVLGRGDCSSNHTCAPCTNPLTGEPTGAPGCP